MPSILAHLPQEASPGSGKLIQKFLHGLMAAGAMSAMHGAIAGVSLLQPPKLVDGNQPFMLTLLISEDGEPTQSSTTYAVPASIAVAASADMVPPVQLQLRRDPTVGDQVTLQHGEFRKVTYRATLPDSLRGVVRIETIGIDASPVLVSVVRPNAATGPVQASAASATAPAAAAAASASVITPGASASPTGTAPAATDLINTSRLSFNEPMYFAVGNGGGNRNAKFQLSFKFRIFQPEDMRSRGLIDNLYLGYTQFSLWDLEAASAPFRDTNYRPSLYYFLPDLGVRNSILSRMGIASGLEHESNGRDGASSRGLNMFFVEPTFTFGNLNGYQFRVSPKVYAYLGPMSDNPDIAHYRGHMDLRLAVGKPDGVEFSTTLRKGARSNYGSVDSMLSYPMAKLIPGTAGFLMTSFFYGYGESLLTYNQKLTPQLRIGYSLWR